MKPLDLLKVVTIARGEARLIIDDLDIKDGADGKQGVDGRDGAHGVKGDAGAVGVSGSDGVDGLHGATGDQGERGLRGFKGVAGIAGVHGEAGVVGDRGKTGATGPQGPKGDDGADGVGVKSAKVHKSDGHLYITLTNGVKIDAGKIDSAGVAVISGGSGPAGKSAYQIAVENGFVGSEQDWLASLGSGFADTFETISKNLRADDAVLAYVDGVLSTITYTDGVVKTLGYTSGTLTTITLSGAPAGVTDIVKSLTYNGGLDGDLIGFSYGPT